MSRLLLPPLLLLLACDGGEKGDLTDDTGPAPDDTGDPGEWPYEAGCISVGPEGGASRGTAASLNDAAAGAQPGDLIDLTGCSGTLELAETLVLDKALTIRGPGADALTLSAPTNYAAVSIEADMAGLVDLTISSTRNGVEIGPVDNVGLVGVVIADTGGWGVSAEGATNLLLQGVVLTGNAYGGVSLVGGTSDIFTSTISENQSYGVSAADGAYVNLDTNAISGNAFTGSTENADGAGVYAEEGATVQMAGNTLADNELLGVFIVNADLSMDGDAVTGGEYGMAVVDDSSVALSGVTLADAVSYGAYVIATGAVSLSGVTISGDPEATANLSDAEWGADGDFSGTGALIVSDDIAVSDSTVTGYNNCGLLLAPDTSGGGVSAVTNVTVQGVGRRGIQVETADATFTDVTVTEMVEVEDQSLTETGRCTSISYAGVLSYGADLSWTGGLLSENGGYGIVNAEGVLSVDGLTAYSNYCGAILNFYGTLTAENSSFSSPGTTASLTTTSTSGGMLLTASIVDYFGVGSAVRNNTFSDNVTPYDYVSSYKSGGSKYTYIYHYAGSYDIYGTTSSDLVVEGNTFTSGSEGSVELFETSATLTGNLWTGYSQALGTYGEESVLFSNNTVEGFDRWGVYCSYGDLEIEDSTFQASEMATTTYDFYLNGVLESTNSYSSSYSALYFYNCSASARDVAMSDLAGQAVVINDYDVGEYEISGLTATNVATEASYSSALDFYSYSSASTTTISLSDVTLTGLGEDGNGLEIYTYYDTADIAVDAEDLTIEGAGQHGVSVDGALATASIASSSISGSGLDGVYVMDGAVAVTDTAITGSGASGIALYSADVVFSDNAATSNAEYGMICEDTSIISCSGNDLTSNALGEQTGCGAECGVEAAP